MKRKSKPADNKSSNPNVNSGKATPENLDLPLYATPDLAAPDLAAPDLAAQRQRVSSDDSPGELPQSSRVEHTVDEQLDQMVEEFTARIRAGEFPSIQEYQQRLPAHAAQVEDLLASVAMIEQIKSSSQPAVNNRQLLDRVSGLKSIGEYEIVGEIGRGGMGVVFEALHHSLGRRVAIKVMPTPLLDAEKYIARFKREAQAAAKLHHTNIVSVFGAGEADGFRYYVMDFVDGLSLSQVIAQLKRADVFSVPTRLDDATQPDNLTRADNLTRPDSLVQPSLVAGPASASRLDSATSVANKLSSTVDDPVAPTTSLPKDQSASSARSTNRMEGGPEAKLPGGLPSESLAEEPPCAPASGLDSTGEFRQAALARHSRDAKHPSHFRWAARLGARLADALAYAHESQLLHRDIKPSNLMLDNSGVVWITDFGLVKDDSHELNLTRTGDVIGTPQYLAPESLEGKYDRRSETYCLGLTLYELVTLEPAYSPGTPAEVIRAIATQSPAAPRSINPAIPLDLSTIIEKSLSRDPNLRYANARAMRDDLLAFVDDRPIKARPPSPLERVMRWGRRNPLPAALTAVSLVLLTMVAVVASIGYVSTTSALQLEAEKSARLAQQKQATDAALQQAEANFKSMKLQYDRAEANIALTIEAFDEMFQQMIGGDIDAALEVDLDGFREIAGVESSLTRKDAAFLRHLLSYYERFASLNQGNEQLRAESARAYRRVGNICQLVGELEAAVEAYQTSLELYRPIWQSDPEAKANLMTQVRIQNELGSAYRRTGSPALAHLLNRSSLKILQDSPLAESDAEVRLELARALIATGYNLYQYVSVTQSIPKPRNGGGAGSGFSGPPRSGSPGKGAFGKGAAASLRNELLNGNPDRSRPAGFERDARQHPPNRGDQAWARRRGLSWPELVAGGRKVIQNRNQQLVLQAIEIVNDLIRETTQAAKANDPDELAYAADGPTELQEYLSVRATCYAILGAAQNFDQRAGLIDYRKLALREFAKLLEAKPESIEYRYSLALAGVGISSEPDKRDLRQLDASAEHCQKLLEQSPERMEYHQVLVSALLKQARIFLSINEAEKAFKSLRQLETSVVFLIDNANSDAAFRRLFSVFRLGIMEVEKQLRAQGEMRLANEALQLNRRISSQARIKFGRGAKRPGNRVGDR